MEVTFFYYLILGMTYCQFCCILLVTKTSSGTRWAGATQGVSTRGAGWLGTILEETSVWYPGSRPFSFLCMEGKITGMTALGNHGTGGEGRLFLKGSHKV